MRNGVQIPCTVGEVFVASGFVPFGAGNMANNTGAVSLESLGDDVHTTSVIYA